MFKTANNDGISRLNSRSKLPFPGNGKGNYKTPREGKGREGKFEACIPGSHGKREFTLTPVTNKFPLYGILVLVVLLCTMWKLKNGQLWQFLLRFSSKVSEILTELAKNWKNKFCATIVFSGVVWTLAEILTANMNFSFTVGQLLYAFHDRCLFRVWELEPPREGAWKSVSPLEEGEIPPHRGCCKCDSAEAGSCDEWCLFYA